MALTATQSATLEKLDAALVKIAQDAPAAFDNIEAAKALVQSVQGVTVTDPEDALQVEQATEAHALIRDCRLQVAKVHKALKEPVNAYAKVVDGHKRELLAVHEPTEKALKAELDKVKEHEAAKARAALHARIEKLRAVNSVYASKPDIVEAYSDEAFEELLDAERAEHVKREEAAALEREAEEKRRAEADRLKAEREAQERALAEERAELERERAALRAEKEAAERVKREAEAAQEPVVEAEPTPEPPPAEVAEPVAWAKRQGFELLAFSAVERPVDPACAFEPPSERDAIEALLTVAREAKATQPDTKLGRMASAALVMYREAQVVKS